MKASEIIKKFNLNGKGDKIAGLEMKVETLEAILQKHWATIQHQKAVLQYLMNLISEFGFCIRTEDEKNPGSFTFEINKKHPLFPIQITEEELQAQIAAIEKAKAADEANSNIANITEAEMTAVAARPASLSNHDGALGV